MIGSAYILSGNGMTWGQSINYVLYRLARKKTTRLRYQPLCLTFAVTDRCTFRCSMCHVHSPVIIPEPHVNRKKRDLSFGLFCEAVKRFPRARRVSFVGTGEPLLHRDIYRMIDFGNKARMFTGTITNGYLLNEQSESICRSNLDSISISINGCSKEDFHRLTGMPADKFDTVLGNVAALVAERNARRRPLRIGVSFILDTKNWSCADRMLEIAADLKIDECDLHNFISAGTDGFRAEERSLFYSKDMAAFFRSLRLPPGVRVGLPRLLRKDRRIQGCHFPFTTLRIDSEGNTGSCCGSLLNLDGRSRYDEPSVWNCNELRKMRRDFLFRRDRLPEPCYVCPHNY